jgi:hypothetical protein
MKDIGSDQDEILNQLTGIEKELDALLSHELGATSRVYSQDLI